MSEPRPPHEGPCLVSLHALAAEVRRLRSERGLSVEQAARLLGVHAFMVERAEGTRYGPMFRLRKRLLREVAGCVLSGPYYEIRPAPPDAP